MIPPGPALLALALSAGSLGAHGGLYRGPVGGPPSGGTTGGARTPSNVPTLPTGSAGIRFMEGAWWMWWEFHKDLFLYRDRFPGEGSPGGRTRTGKGRAPLARSFVEQEVVPALMAALRERDPHREVVTGCLVALGRLRPRGEAPMKVMESYLKDIHLHSETAALSLGISGNEEAVPLLLGLVKDDKEGRKAVGRGEVSYRTRAFASYGLGILCRSSMNGYLKVKVLRELSGILDRKDLRPDVEVAVIHAIRLFAQGGEGFGILREDASKLLLGRFEKRTSSSLVRAHLLTALSEVVGRGEDPTGKVRKILLGIIDGRKGNPWLHQSAVTGLGKIGSGGDKELLDRLSRYIDRGKDRHAKNLAAIALGEIGGKHARTILLRKLSKARKTLKPWMALGLALLADGEMKRSPSSRVDVTLAEAVLDQMKRLNVHIDRAGLAIALGIIGYPPASRDISGSFRILLNADKSNSYYAQSLGLIGEPSVSGILRRVVDESIRKPMVLSEAARALAILGDRSAAPILQSLMEKESPSIHVQASIAQALGHIAGRKEALLLLDLLGDREKNGIVRGYAGVALGILGEPTRWPWHMRLAMGINYAAPTETMISGGNGVLEIL